MQTTKRGLTDHSLAASGLPAKCLRATEAGRLCDLRGALADVFASGYNASRAREKGYLRSRDASGKYEEVCGVAW